MRETDGLKAFIKKLRDTEIRMKRGKSWLLDSIISPSKLWARMTGGESWYWDKVRCEVEGKDFPEMWHTSERGDWLLWLSTHLIGKRGWPTHQQVVFASCQCARQALRHVKPNEARPLNAIETTEAWTRGQATLDDVIAAGHAANYMEHDDTAFCAAQAAYSAAWAVYSEEDGCCFRLAQAASGAASWAASAASYEILTAQHEIALSGTAGAAVRDHAEKATLQECANIVRRMLCVPNELP